MKKIFQAEAKSLKDLPLVAQSFLTFLERSGSRLCAFEGEMGVGKTTFINALLREMKIDEDGSSPTFALVNEYRSDEFGRILHCDFYRLNSPEEAYDIGIEEILGDENRVFIEWPSKLGNLLPENCVQVKMTQNEGVRLIEASV